MSLRPVHVICFTALAGLLGACAQPPAAAPGPHGATPPVPALAPVLQTEAVRQGAAKNLVAWDPGNGGGPRFFGATDVGGIERYAADGRRLGRVDGVEVEFLQLLSDFPLGARRAPLLIAFDLVSESVLAWEADPAGEALQPRLATPIAVGDEVTGLCAWRSTLTGAHYLFAVTGEGVIQQWELYADGANTLAGRLVRTIPAGKDSGYCVADARTGTLYFSEESTGVWRIDAEPETDAVRAPVDMAAPFGGLGEESKGLALYPLGADGGYLAVSDVEAGEIALYALPGYAPAGRFAVEGLGEADGLMITRAITAPPWTGGLFAVADEDAGDGQTEFRLLAWDTIATALGLPRGETAATPALPQAPRGVAARRETDPVGRHGDAADDPAIWVNPRDPAASRVIATNKKQGLFVYDLQGRTVQELPDGRMNNVDLRAGFVLGGREVALVAASNRTLASLSLYALDPHTGALAEVADGRIDAGLADPYGLCMYRGADGSFHVFMTDGASGAIRQWRLVARANGRVGAEPVRELRVASQAEGCVADDERGLVYIGEEDVAIWRAAAAPDGGTALHKVVGVDDGGPLTADVEGLALYVEPDGRGYLIASNQGADNYALFRRDGDNAFVGHFHVVANPAAGVDGASETDGLELLSAPLGPDYPRGLLVVQDGRNLGPSAPQNFKYVDWRDIAAAMDLP